MSATDTDLVVWVTGGAGLGYQRAGLDFVLVRVGEPMELRAQRDLGIRADKLLGRHLAFLALLILDREGELKRRPTVGKPKSLNSLIAEYMGPSVESFQRWVARTIVPESNSIVQTAPDMMRGRSPSRTGGPWTLAVRNVALYPDARHAWTFIGEIAQTTAHRKSDPEALLADAEKQAALDNWTDAEQTLLLAHEIYQRRRWRRNDPVWFAIRLREAHFAMQLGLTDGTPQHARNILRSLTKQRLDSVEARIIAGKAHHNAALVWGQRPEVEAASRTLSALESAEDALRGISLPAAVNELWRVRGYREVTLAKVRAEAKTPARSVVMQATSALPHDKEEGWLRYGQTLLCANDAGRAVDYIRPALDSGKLSTPAWVIAERLNAAAEWKLGASQDVTLGKLSELRQNVKRLGFRQQLQLIERQRQKVLRRNRTVVTR